VGHAFAKLMQAQGMTRTGVSFYALRHAFETIAGEIGDQPAVDRTMGHADASMAGSCP
jgi:integrase